MYIIRTYAWMYRYYNNTQMLKYAFWWLGSAQVVLVTRATKTYQKNKIKNERSLVILTTTLQYLPPRGTKTKNLLHWWCTNNKFVVYSIRVKSPNCCLVVTIIIDQLEHKIKRFFFICFFLWIEHVNINIFVLKFHCYTI